jgi:Antimicrobial peptide resistance and lipid A acylation protein PagP
MKHGYTDDAAPRDFSRQCAGNARKGLSVLALIFTVVTGLFAHPAAAGELSLLVNGKAIHINTPAGVKLNEKNWGLGLQYDWDVVNKKWVPFVAVSGFSDSNKNPSYYAGGGVMRRFQFDDTHVDLGIIGFVMTRKDYKNDQPFLGVLPAFSVGTKRISLNMTYIPKVHPKAVPLWFFQLKIGLSNFR